MKVAIVTTSRADYGIFKPLISALNELNEWELEIIVTGSHLSLYHGDSYNELKEDFPFLKYELVPALLTSHDPCSVALNYGLVVMRFAEFWKDHLDYNVVFVLGDRYELAALVAAGIPFQIPFAHLHGGEVTLGAIDQSYRDFITIVSKWNFTAEKGSYERVLKLKLPMENQNVFNVGSLAIDALRSHEDCSAEVFYEKTGLHLNDDFILVTVHPETLDLGGNLINSEIFSKVIEFQVNHSNRNFLVSLPNTDPASEIWRRMWIRLAKLYSHKIFCVEHLGVKLYYSAMRNCQFMLGNTSSGIIEAASLRCWVINLGKRQLGRAVSENVIQCEYDFDSIMSAIDHVLGRKFRFEGENIYGNGSSAQIIINLLKAQN